MDEALFITSFRHLEIEGRKDQCVELMPGINITNDESVRRDLLTPELLKGIGKIEYDYLLKAPNVVFYEYDKDDLIKLRVVKPEPFLTAILIWIEGLFRDAWLIQDHVMECDAAFLHFDRTSQRAGWSSNYLAVRPTFADGAPRKSIKMPVDELVVWADKHDHVSSYLYEKQSSSIQFMMRKGFSRTGRAMQFITAARHARDLAFKITHYCSALETLFTTDVNELAHKLSERVAFFLGKQGYQ